MPNHARVLPGVLLSLAVCIVNTVSAVHNPEHIFNAIHSSMRQWGSSLNHNGVSFFRAGLPQGIQLYHGDQRPDLVQGREWLAFEPEHAMNFAVKLCDSHSYADEEDVEFTSPRSWFQHGMTERSRRDSDHGQKVFGPPPRICFEPGWFHTYAPVRDLNLLYIGGMSAAKTNLGTLDSQDFVLVRNTSKVRRPSNPWADLRRADDLCELARTDLRGKIDGFIRMEHGFEVLLCDFALLETISVLRAARGAETSGPMRYEGLDVFNFLRAITSRYHGIGGQRVRIDYDKFVTAFNHPEIDLWTVGGEQPRLHVIGNGTASALLDEVKQMILAHSELTQGGTDWQNVADMYVDRYARPIQNLVSSNFKTAEGVHKEIRRLLEPYLNGTSIDRDATIKRCQQAYIPRHLVDKPNPSMGQQAVEQTALHLCSHLYSVLVESDGLEAQKTGLRKLMDTLKWTAWKDCRPGCALDEICFTAIWPFGTQEDHDEPNCRNATELVNRFGYWWKDDDVDWW